MKEWQLYNHYVQGRCVQFNWILPGEVKLDLVLIGPRDESLGRPYFEMARNLSDERLVRTVNPIEQEDALKTIRSGGIFTDCFWKGSAEELEKYCGENLLPLPEDYQDAWAVASRQ